jgi:dTDP-4-dehydrorhamnose 3,5-epimerase
MDVRTTPLDGVLLLQPPVYEDARGCFFESWQQARFDQAVGSRVHFVQDSHSRSKRGVLRGLHYQLPPHAMGKLVRVVHGAAFDVAVDVREGSSGFGRWFGVELSAANRLQLWIPPGHAHGFVALSDWADCVYKSTAVYTPASERVLAWNDPRFAIGWPDPGVPLQLSPRDRDASPGVPTGWS